jgi:hypothetical protein
MFYTMKKLVAQVMNEMNLQNMYWKIKAWSKLIENPNIQTLMPVKLACPMQTMEGTHIIENLSNSLNHRVGALKRDGVKHDRWFTIWWFLKTFEAKGQPQKIWVLIGDSYTRR